MIIFRPPPFKEAAWGTPKLTSEGEKRFKEMLRAIFQEKQGLTAGFHSPKVKHKAFAEMIRQFTGIPFVETGMLMCGKFEYYTLEQAAQFILLETARRGAETALVMTGNDFCHRVPTYAFNSMHGRVGGIKGLPEYFNKGDLAVISMATGELKML